MGTLLEDPAITSAKQNVLGPTLDFLVILDGQFTSNLRIDQNRCTLKLRIVS
jgi:hypothetical protein